jgi:hypothetical protein
MPDQHQQSKATVRPPAELKDAVHKVLAEADDWTVNDFVIACMRMLVKRPKTFLKQLEVFKPPRKRGRPPKPKP